MNIELVSQELRKYSSKPRAKALQRFFKTGPGEYGEGDIFIGVKVPDTRKVAKKYRDLDMQAVKILLSSPIHEERLLALLILVHQYSCCGPSVKKDIYKIYLSSTKYINNWDLVDLSAGKILGHHLSVRSRGPLYKLARSTDLWERRISIIATSHFIGNNDFEDTLKIAKIFLHDKEDLIHKAVGWMLREIGKRDLAVEEDFLKEHYKIMPRTMLRYAIERFPDKKRQKYLKGKV